MEGLDAGDPECTPLFGWPRHVGGFSDLAGGPARNARRDSGRICLRIRTSALNAAGGFTEAKQFNLMFKTHVGLSRRVGNSVFEARNRAGHIFVNFENVLTTSRRKLPFGIAQVGSHSGTR